VYLLPLLRSAASLACPSRVVSRRGSDTAGANFWESFMETEVDELRWQLEVALRRIDTLERELAEARRREAVAGVLDK
jgi:hypothetical protein